MKIAAGHLAIIKKILSSHVPAYEVWAFGSRVHGRGFKKFSDVDLAIMAETPIEPLRIADLREAFSESDLPFKVDIIDLASTEEPFRKIIERDHEVVQRPVKG